MTLFRLHVFKIEDTHKGMSGKVKSKGGFRCRMHRAAFTNRNNEPSKFDSAIGNGYYGGKLVFP